MSRALASLHPFEDHVTTVRSTLLRLAVCAALQKALGNKGEGPIVWRSSNTNEGVWDLLQKPEETRKLVSVETR